MKTAAALIVAVVAVVAGAGRETVAVPGKDGARKSAASVRSERRAYDGAPPVVGHQDFGADCGSCHNALGIEVPGVGFAPASPHDITLGMGDRSQVGSATLRCRQCHVFQLTDEVFRPNGFEGLRQDLRAGARLYPGAPPVLPHKTFMRENCSACHVGPAAREEIRTSHPERQRCRQCHVPSVTNDSFVRN